MMIHNQSPSPAELEERARKRAAIGLAPERPTAKAAPQRPPRLAKPRGCLWTPVLLVVALATTTTLLLTARLVGSPTDWLSVQGQIRAWWATISPEVAAETSSAYRLVLADEFEGEDVLLAANRQDGQWLLDRVAAESVYTLQLEPNRLAWSTVGGALTNYSLSGSFTVVDVTPDAATGFIGRYQDRDNFYLFAVNGRGQFRVQLLYEGTLQTLVPWTTIGWLHPAGQRNLLALADDAAGLHFYANGTLLHDLAQLQLPPGDVGVFGAAPGETLAEIHLDWLRLYALQQE